MAAILIRDIEFEGQGSRFLASYPGARTMVVLTEMVETRVRETTHNRIRGLTVEEDHGRVVIRGQAATHHTRQMALQGALELLSGDRLRTEITVG